MDQEPRPTPSAVAGVPHGEAGLVISWLVRLVVVLVAAGLLLVEVAGVLIARLSAADTAAKAAQEAGFAYRSSADLQRATQAAQEKVESEGAVFDGLTLDPAARTATVSVHKEAKTLVVQHIPPLREYATAAATETTPLPE